jgi:hypothetical protein
MRSLHPGRRAASIVFAALGLAAAPPRLAAQNFCLNGSPPPACSSFMILEMGGVLPVAQTSRTVRSGQGSYPVQSFDDRLQWEVGAMKNLDERWAVGGSARLGSGSSGVLTGLAARGRRRLGPVVSVDMSAGVGFSSFGGTRHPDPVVDARLNFRDDFYAGLRYESARVPPSSYLDYQDPGGRQHAVSVLVGTGSEWAIGASGLLAIGLAVLLATVDFE